MVTNIDRKMLAVITPINKAKTILKLNHAIMFMQLIYSTPQTVKQHVV